MFGTVGDPRPGCAGRGAGWGLGTAAAARLGQVAAATGGQAFDVHGRSLADVVAAIRGCQ
ncbi:MAG: hypothetical protein ACJ73S_05425 [Mycobacteriales bacterium]